MLFRATIILLPVFCFTYVVSLGDPLKFAVNCNFGYRVRPEANGKTQGMCTIAGTTDDYACEGCDPTVPKGEQCVESTGDVPLGDLKKSTKNLLCPNYEKLMPKGQFAGFGCADAKKGQKARCLSIKNPTFCKKGACRLNVP